MKVVALLSILLFHEARGLSSGAPSGACENLTPSPAETAHGPDAQTTATPYTVTVDKTMFHAGDEIKVTVDGDPTFRGFLCQPRPDVTMPTTIGSIPLDANYVNVVAKSNCNAAIASITHSEASDKDNVTFTWKAPAEMMENGPMEFYIVCTIVQTQKVFWMGVMSPKITYMADMTGTTQSNMNNTDSNMSSTQGNNGGTTQGNSGQAVAGNIVLMLCVVVMFFFK